MSHPSSGIMGSATTRHFDSILFSELRFVMREAFVGRGEIFVDRCEMIFQRLVKSSSMPSRSLVLSASSCAMRCRIEAMPAARFAGFIGLPVTSSITVSR